MTDYKYLTVSKELGEEIRSQPGRNDSERVRNWADSKESKDVKENLNIDDVEGAVSRVLSQELPEILRREVT